MAQSHIHHPAYSSGVPLPRHPSQLPPQAPRSNLPPPAAPHYYVPPPRPANVSSSSASHIQQPPYFYGSHASYQHGIQAGLFSSSPLPDRRAAVGGAGRPSLDEVMTSNAASGARRALKSGAALSGLKNQSSTPKEEPATVVAPAPASSRAPIPPTSTPSAARQTALPPSSAGLAPASVSSTTSSWLPLGEGEESVFGGGDGAESDVTNETPSKRSTDSNCDAQMEINPPASTGWTTSHWGGAVAVLHDPASSSESGSRNDDGGSWRGSSESPVKVQQVAVYIPQQEKKTKDTSKKKKASKPTSSAAPAQPTPSSGLLAKIDQSQLQEADLPPQGIPPGPRPTTKPQFSYAAMIGQAIFASDRKKLSLAEIYTWISIAYPFYKKGESGWMNSIRHNLSLNKCFEKVERDVNGPQGKGMLWAIVPGTESQFEGGNFRKIPGPLPAGGNKQNGSFTAFDGYHYANNMPPNSLSFIPSASSYGQHQPLPSADTCAVAGSSNTATKKRKRPVANNKRKSLNFDSESEVEGGAESEEGEWLPPSHQRPIMQHRTDSTLSSYSQMMEGREIRESSSQLVALSSPHSSSTSTEDAVVSPEKKMKLSGPGTVSWTTAIPSRSASRAKSETPPPPTRGLPHLTPSASSPISSPVLATLPRLGGHALNRSGLGAVKIAQELDGDESDLTDIGENDDPSPPVSIGSSDKIFSPKEASFNDGLQPAFQFSSASGSASKQQPPMYMPPTSPSPRFAAKFTNTGSPVSSMRATANRHDEDDLDDEAARIGSPSAGSTLNNAFGSIGKYIQSSPLTQRKGHSRGLSGTSDLLNLNISLNTPQMGCFSPGKNSVSATPGGPAVNPLSTSKTHPFSNLIHSTPVLGVSTDDNKTIPPMNPMDLMTSTLSASSSNNKLMRPPQSHSRDVNQTPKTYGGFASVIHGTPARTPWFAQVNQSPAGGALAQHRAEMGYMHDEDVEDFMDPYDSRRATLDELRRINNSSKGDGDRSGIKEVSHLGGLGFSPVTPGPSGAWRRGRVVPSS